jgi:XTP/dITP diphosphohydrolase
MKLVFASNNQNKIVEIKLLLPPTIEILSLEDIGCFEEIPETANTIEGNAQLKANYVTQKYGFDCFADDSGLEIESLNGEPGVHSARYAGQQKNEEDNINKVLDKLAKNPNRKAQFKTIIALNLNGTQLLFSGTVSGEITTERHGNQGFGYDPIFKADGMNRTFAELSITEKGAISHRGKATKLLIDFLLNQ